ASIARIHGRGRHARLPRPARRVRATPAHTFSRARPPMRGHCILSHGFESGPDATKVTALAETAERLGCTCERPGDTDLDAMQDAGDLGDVAGRVRRLHGLASAAAARGPLVLAGSSLGAWISGHVSLQVQVAGLFLMAPPVRMHAAHPLDAAAVPTSIIHGWDDDLCRPDDVLAWAASRRARLLMVDDGHRLSRHVQASADAFGQLLAAL